MLSFFSRRSKANKANREETSSGGEGGRYAVNLGDSTTLVAAPGRTSTLIEGEAVIMDPDSGQYFSLSHVGARAWELVRSPQTLAAVRQVILSEYNVEIERCQRDLLALFEELVAEGLVKIVDSPANSV